MKTTAIIVAAGSGTRFKSDTPKQFLEIHGKTVIVHTLEKFQAAASIDSIVLVLSAERISDLGQPNISKLVAIVEGGPTRAESVRNGLSAIPDDTEVVAVHDGARPLVTVDEIDRTVAKAKDAGAACLVAPVTDTIKTIRGTEIAATLDRQNLRRALTPQAFNIEILRRAFDASDLGDSVTDECYLVEKLGNPISAVEGSPLNLKITQPEDLLFAETLLKNG